MKLVIDEMDRNEPSKGARFAQERKIIMRRFAIGSKTCKAAQRDAGRFALAVLFWEAINLGECQADGV